VIEQYCVKSRNSFGVEDWACYQFNEWQQLDLAERISLIRERRVKFYTGDGKEVSPNQAVKNMF